MPIDLDSVSSAAPKPGFTHACFISYIHGEGDLGRSFMLQFIAALQGELEQLVDLKTRPIFCDILIKPGEQWPYALAQALCRSVCMVMVYSPVYGKRPECVREFEAMLRVEALRRQHLGGGDPSHRYIIPVVLRGFDRLPPLLQKDRHALDFSQFTLAEAPIQSNQLFVKEVRRIAERIHECLDALEPLEHVACEGCSAFELPAPNEVKLWQAQAATWRQPFPGR